MNRPTTRATVTTVGPRPHRVSLLSTLVPLLLSTTPLVVVHAQQSPSLFVDKFDTSRSYRTNVCDRQRDVWDGTRDLPTALQGLDLTVVLTNYRVPDSDKYFTLVPRNPLLNEASISKNSNTTTTTTSDPGIIHPQDPGLFAVILDEVARRAGFSWRNSFAVAGPLNTTTDGPNATWTDILKWGVDTFDISVEKWGSSIGRTELGISFPAGWWDSSIVLVEQMQPQTRVVHLWSFWAPFTPVVWILIVASILVTGLLYWFLEYLDPKADERELDSKPMTSVFYAALVFVGNFDLQPNTDAARILSWSWTFWAVIVGSAYTANMASFLVSPQVDVFAISTMEQAIDLQANVCVQNGGVLTSILHDRFGEENLRLVPKNTEAEIFLGLKDGSCQVAAHQMNTYRIYEKNLDVNHDCTLSSELRVVQPVPAGMATAIDTGGENQYCTSLVSHVLDYHLTTMIAEGFVERAIKYHLSKISTVECISEPPRAGDFSGSTFSLTLQDLGGIFILHLMCVSVALVAGIFQFYRYNTTEKPLSEVFFVQQAKKEVQRRRESIQNMTLRRPSTSHGGGGRGDDGHRNSLNTHADSTLFSAGGSGNDSRSSHRRHQQSPSMVGKHFGTVAEEEEELSSSLSTEGDAAGVRVSDKSVRSNISQALLEILEEDGEDVSVTSNAPSESHRWDQDYTRDQNVIESSTRAAAPTLVPSLVDDDTPRKENASPTTEDSCEQGEPALDVSSDEKKEVAENAFRHQDTVILSTKESLEEADHQVHSGTEKALPLFSATGSSPSTENRDPVDMV